MWPARRKQRGEVPRRQARRKRTHHFVIAPVCQSAEVRHHRRALLDLADAFEWLVPL